MVGSESTQSGHKQRRTGCWWYIHAICTWLGGMWPGDRDDHIGDPFWAAMGLGKDMRFSWAGDCRRCQCQRALCSSWWWAPHCTPPCRKGVMRQSRCQPTQNYQRVGGQERNKNKGKMEGGMRKLPYTQRTFTHKTRWFVSNEFIIFRLSIQLHIHVIL